MKQTFTYREKMSFSYFYPVIAFVIIAGLCWYFQYGIAFKNLRLLAYPNSVYVTGGIALLFLVSAIIRVNKANRSRKNPHPVTVEETGFSFPRKEGKVELLFTDIAGMRNDEDEDDGKSFVITANGKEYEFFEERFESPAQYAAFVESIRKGTGA